MTTGSDVDFKTKRRKRLDRKRSVISIESGRNWASKPEPPPPSASGKREFNGNQFTARGVVIMFRNWSQAASTHHRIPLWKVEQIVAESLQESGYRDVRKAA